MRRRLHTGRSWSKCGGLRRKNLLIIPRCVVKQNQKKLLMVVIAAIPLVVAAAYFMSRPSASRENLSTQAEEAKQPITKLPSASAKEASVSAPGVVAPPKPVSRSVTRQELIQKFDASRQCAYHDMEIKNAESINAACERYAAHPELQHYKECHAEAAINEQLISALKADSQGCPAGKDATLAYFHDTVEAAKAGDADAQVCYIESAFYVDGRQILDYSEADRSAYQHDAPAYIQQGLERGDWRVAVLLLSKHPAGMRNTVDMEDPVMRYKMNRLLRLGADGQYADMLDKDAKQDYLSPGISQAPRLSQEQAAQANQEAQDTFDRSFKGKEPLSKPPTICRALPTI